MDRFRVGLMSCVLALACAGTASAQSEGQMYARGLFGVTFGTSSSDVVLAGTYGVAVTSTLDVFGEIGWMGNVLDSDTGDLFDVLEDTLERQFNVDIDASLKARSFYGIGGVRFNPDLQTRIKPFAEGGIGFARTKLNVDIEVAGIDLSDEFEAEFDTDESSTDFLLMLGGGVNIPINTSFSVDAGYRFNRIFSDPGLNVSQVYGAAKFAF